MALLTTTRALGQSEGSVSQGEDAPAVEAGQAAPPESPTAAGAEPETDAALYARIVELRNWSPTPGASQKDSREQLMQSQLQVIGLVDQLLRDYPDSAHREDAQLAKLQVLAQLARIGTVPAAGLRAAAESILSERPSERLAADAEYRLIEAFNFETRGDTANKKDNSEAVQQRHAAYLEKYPNSPHAAAILLGMVRSAARAGDVERAKEMLSDVSARFPNAADLNDARTEVDRAVAVAKREEAIGKPFSLSFTDMNGNSIDTAALKGKVVLVPFWASWCGYCRKAIPTVQSLYEKYHDQGLEIVGVSLDGDRKKLEDYMASESIEWPQYFDGKKWQNDLAQKWGVSSVPAIFLVDKQGNLRSLNCKATMEQDVPKLLAE